MRRLALPAILIAAALLTLAVWALPNRPVALAPPVGGKLLSMSFAAFHDGQSPLTHVYPSLEQIDEDLRTISRQVASVRTYSSLEGMEDVPALARKYGLTVTMGAWLGQKAITNELEIASLIKLANQYPDVIKRVIVGNEVLLRGDLTPEQLAGYIARVRREIKQPVSTADVWEFWLRYPQMADSVDFITIHLLPYWEDDPVGVDHAAERIVSAYHQISARFPGKPILVGEAGWPTAGRTRGPAVPGVVNQARFNAAFMRVAALHGFDYNLIEAFDQRWKIKLEGTVGGKWGLYSVGRSAKYSVTKPVVEDPNWPVKACLSVALGLILFVAALRRGSTLPLSGQAVVALFAQALATALVHAADIAFSWHYYTHDLMLAAGMLGLQAVLVAAILAELVRLWRYPVVLYDAAQPEPREGAALTFWGGKAMTALTALAILWSFLIVVDGRYRDFPIASYLIPALGMPALAFCRALRRPPGCEFAVALSASHLLGAYAQSHDEAGVRHGFGYAVLTVPTATVFSLLLGMGAVSVVMFEGTVNREAVMWAVLQVTMAIPYVAMMVATVRGTEPLPPVKQL